MTKLSFLCICILILQTYAEEKPKDDRLEDKAKKLGDTVGAIAGIAGRPEVAAVLAVMKELKTESSTTLGPLNTNSGFYSIHNSFDHSSGAILIENLDKLFKIWFADDAFNNMDAGYKTILATAIEEYTLQLKEEAYKKHKYSINFQDGKGIIYMFVISLEPHPKNLNAVKWTKQMLTSGFVPAPDWIVMTHSDCDIFSCDKTDEIVYLPPKITESHMQSLININKNMLLGFSNIYSTDNLIQAA